MRKLTSALLAGVALSLSGCAYGLQNGGSYGGLSVGVGYGDGYGYSPYGYGGYGSPYGYDGYGGYGGYGSYAGYGGYPYYGWYGDRYYPGTGYYVYDRYRRPYVWSDRERNFWTQVRERIDTNRTTNDSTVRNRTQSSRPQLRPNWEGFERRPRVARDARRAAVSEERRERREVRRAPVREERRSPREARRERANEERRDRQ